MSEDLTAEEVHHLNLRAFDDEQPDVYEVIDDGRLSGNPVIRYREPGWQATTTNYSNIFSTSTRIGGGEPLSEDTLRRTIDAVMNAPAHPTPRNTIRIPYRSSPSRGFVREGALPVPGEDRIDTLEVSSELVERARSGDSAFARVFAEVMRQQMEDIARQRRRDEELWGRR